MNKIKLLIIVLFLSSCNEVEIVPDIIGYYQGEDSYKDVLNIRESTIIYRDDYIADSYLFKDDSLIFTCGSIGINSTELKFDFKLKYNISSQSFAGTRLRYDETWTDNIKQVIYKEIE